MASFDDQIKERMFSTMRFAMVNKNRVMTFEEMKQYLIQYFPEWNQPEILDQIALPCHFSVGLQYFVETHPFMLRRSTTPGASFTFGGPNHGATISFDNAPTTPPLNLPN